jgi:hypothetical protein
LARILGINSKMTDFTFKTLHIPSFAKIKEEIAELHKTMPCIPGRFSIIDTEKTLKALPTLVEWFNENDLKVRQVAYISIGANTTQVAHIDSGDPCLALNFPVINCEYVTTQFIEYIPEELTVQYSIGSNLPYYHYNSIDKKIIGSFSLIEPTLLNIKMPHRVVNNTNLERISLSFRFIKDPWHL